MLMMDNLQAQHVINTLLKGNFSLYVKESNSFPLFAILGQHCVMPNVMSTTFPIEEHRTQVHHEKLEQAIIKLSQL